MSKVRWTCERCGKGDEIDLPPGTKILDGFDIIVKAHQEISPECSGLREGLKVTRPTGDDQAKRQEAAPARRKLNLSPRQRDLLKTRVNLVDLEDKWSADSPDEPTCASCGKMIEDPEVPLRFWRNGATEELALCHACFMDRAL